MSKKIWEQIKPNNWCKGDLATSNGRRCALGWIYKVYGNNVKGDSIERKFEKHIKANYGCSGIATFNDKSRTSCKDVKEVFKAIDA